MLDKNELRAARARCGYTQKSLAREIGISPSKLSNKENGRAKFTMSDIGNIAKVLHLTADDIARIFFAEIVALKGKSA